MIISKFNHRTLSGVVDSRVRDLSIQNSSMEFITDVPRTVKTLRLGGDLTHLKALPAPSKHFKLVVHNASVSRDVMIQAAKRDDAASMTFNVPKVPNDVELVRALLATGMSSSAIRWCRDAADQGWVDVVRCIVLSGEYPLTDLMKAVIKGSRNKVRAILETPGADVNAKTFQGQTALHFARDPDIISELLMRDADVNARDCLGMTPVMWMAATHDDPRLFKVLEFFRDDVEWNAIAWINGIAMNARAFAGVYRRTSMFEALPIVLVVDRRENSIIEPTGTVKKSVILESFEDDKSWLMDYDFNDW